MIRVVLVDDHVMIREGCRRVLEAAGDIEVTGQAGSAEEALPLVRSLRPQVVLMDIHLPGASGLQATERLTATQPEARVIVLTMIDELPMPQRLLEAGAWGYLTKSCPADELIRAVRQVGQGKRFLSTEIASKLALSSLRSGGKESPVDLLTQRELEVALRLAQGHSNKDVANQLHISEKTISTHKTRVLEKLGVANVVALANLLAHHGLLRPGALADA
jgi:two-component system invasion response regulator UvrY